MNGLVQATAQQRARSLPRLFRRPTRLEQIGEALEFPMSRSRTRQKIVYFETGLLNAGRNMMEFLRLYAR